MVGNGISEASTVPRCPTEFHGHAKPLVEGTSSFFWQSNAGKRLHKLCCGIDTLQIHTSIYWLLHCFHQLSWRVTQEMAAVCLWGGHPTIWNQLKSTSPFSSTPLKINMEPKIHPIEKENPLPSLQLFRFDVDFPGCMNQVDIPMTKVYITFPNWEGWTTKELRILFGYNVKIGDPKNQLHIIEFDGKTMDILFCVPHFEIIEDIHLLAPQQLLSCRIIGRSMDSKLEVVLRNHCD